MQQSGEGVPVLPKQDASPANAVSGSGPPETSSLIVHSASSVGAQPGDAQGEMDSAQSTSAAEGADATRPSDEQILSYENQIKYVACLAEKPPCTRV
jgi:hypothetical protein